MSLYGKTSTINGGNGGNNTMSYDHQRFQPHFSEKIENYYRTSQNVYRLGNSYSGGSNHGLNSNNFLNNILEKTMDNKLHHPQDVYELYVDVQGFQPEEITVTTQQDLLIISGYHEQNHPKYGYHSREFRNKYTLPKNVEKDKMTCLFKDRGRLLIEAPILKPEEPNTRTIPIKILNQTSSSAPSETMKSSNGHTSPTSPTLPLSAFATTSTNANGNNNNNIQSTSRSNSDPTTTTQNGSSNSVSHV